jgi:hypothetical protein
VKYCLLLHSYLLDLFKVVGAFVEKVLKVVVPEIFSYKINIGLC